MSEPLYPLIPPDPERAARVAAHPRRDRIGRILARAIETLETDPNANWGDLDEMLMKENFYDWYADGGVYPVPIYRTERWAAGELMAERAREILHEAELDEADTDTYYARHHYEPRVARALELLAIRGEFGDPTSIEDEATPGQYCGRCRAAEDEAQESQS